MASDLVTDSKLVVRFSAQHIHHAVFVSDARPGQQVRRRRKEETWEKVEHLGQGGGGTVWLERCLSVDSQPKTRAVKAIPKQTPFSQPIDYKRELEAIAKFSQTKYKGLFVRSFGWRPSNMLKAAIARAREPANYLLTFGRPSTAAYKRICPPRFETSIKESPDYWWVKIGDFGISKRVSDGQAYLRTPIGTHGFIPPEILENDGSDLQYTAKVDMWSLGVLIHYMITNTLPFDDKRKLRQYIRTSHFPWTKLASYSVSKECHDFVTKGLLGTTAASRLSASDALQHQCLIDTCTSAPNKDAIEASDTQYVPVAETEPTNDQGRGKDSTAGSVLPELTDASASWSAQIGEESQISIRTKYEVAQGLQEVQGKTTAIQQSIFTKDVLVSDLSNDLRIFHDEGLSLLGQQQHSGAKIMLEEALNLRQNALGTYHEDTMASLSALGDVLCVQKKYTEAEATYRDI